MNMSRPLRWLLSGSQSGRQLRLAAAFLAFFALALTLSPAVGNPEPIDLGGLRWSHWIGLATWLAAFYWMQRAVSHELPEHDRLLLPLAGLLTGWGLLTVWRLTVLFGLRQALWVLVCTALIISLLRYKNQLLPLLRRYKYLWLLAGFIITALTFFFGTNPSGIGPDLWLGCCGLYFQPSEPLKLLLIIYLAAYLADRQPLMRGLGPLLAPTFVMSGLALLLLLIQRDLGTAWVFIFIYTVMIYAATGERRILLASLLSIMLALFFGYEFIPLVHARIEAWLNPWLDSSGGAYQIVQGILAVAAGGLFGRGPGMGSPGFVPVAHTDFIYTSVVEESGLLGAIGLLLLIALISLRALRIALRARDAYPRYLAIGLSAYLACQALLIIGGNIRLLPLTGVTLPFVSYGGSSLLTSFFALLLLLLISDQSASRHAPPPRGGPTLTITAGYLIAFGLAALVTGWWGLLRAPDLLTRPDNARRTQSELVVRRGDLLDRNDLILNTTQGLSGEYTRSYNYSALSPLLGYSHPLFGQVGLEASLDSILRGEEYQPALTLLMDELLYGQTPAGLDVRLSLDALLQLQATSLLGDQPGAAVVLDAITGDILVLASTPTYDANKLDENWESLSDTDYSPLLNRAIQAAYPPGLTLAPFIYTAALGQSILPAAPGPLTYELDNATLECQRQPANPANWAAVIASACPGPIAELGLTLGSQGLISLYRDLDFYSPTPLRLEAHTPSAISIERPGLAALGRSTLRLSPLQIALAAATLSNYGELPPAHLALAVEQSDGQWLELEPLTESRAVLNRALTAATAQELRSPYLPLWQYAAPGVGENGETVTWYMAGSMPGGTKNYVVVILLEQDNPILAKSIGQRLWLAAINQE
ncbi:MAG: hypothetical protein DWG76_02600 [Chloroflexi bacterium]|nr:hypothetical protein [Chloroflexota bacterium]